MPRRAYRVGGLFFDIWISWLFIQLFHRGMDWMWKDERTNGRVDVAVIIIHILVM